MGKDLPCNHAKELGWAGSCKLVDFALFKKATKLFVQMKSYATLSM